MSGHVHDSQPLIHVRFTCTQSRLTRPGHSRAYTWRQKINTASRPTHLTAARSTQSTWSAVLTLAASPQRAIRGPNNNKRIKQRRKLLYFQNRPNSPRDIGPLPDEAGPFVTKSVTGENIPNLTIRYSYLYILSHRCFLILLLQRIPTQTIWD